MSIFKKPRTASPTGYAIAPEPAKGEAPEVIALPPPSPEPKPVPKALSGRSPEAHVRCADGSIHNFHPTFTGQGIPVCLHCGVEKP